MIWFAVIGAAFAIGLYAADLLDYFDEAINGNWEG